jgi:hypothetical protein
MRTKYLFKLKFVHYFTAATSIIENACYFKHIAEKKNSNIIKFWLTYYKKAVVIKIEHQNFCHHLNPEDKKGC